MATVQQALDRANPNDLADSLRKMSEATGGPSGLGQVLAALRPRTTSRSGLTSSTTQVHNARSLILSVENVAGTPLSIITGGSPGAGEVSLDYDATGLPTLEFAGAVTAYIVNETGDLGDLAAAMAQDAGTSH